MALMQMMVQSTIMYFVLWLIFFLWSVSFSCIIILTLSLFLNLEIYWSFFSFGSLSSMKYPETEKEDFLFRCYNLSPGIGWEGWSGRAGGGNSWTVIQSFCSTSSNKQIGNANWLILLLISKAHIVIQILAELQE